MRESFTVPSIALLTDLYQLTMAFGYWKSGTADRHAAFHLFYRRNPFGGGYAVACGLQTAIECLRSFRFEADDIRYLKTLTGNDGCPLFCDAFLKYLTDLQLSCDVDAVPEGTIVFAHEPLLRISGPILQCQLLETILLNVINFSTLVATKASRVCAAAKGDPVLEFGLRRAQGMNGGLAASRAAYIGGCAATSNVLAGKTYGIPVKGTHAHSWVMSFDSEAEAFRAYAQAMPNNCVFLVDTYDTLEGVRNAVAVGKELRASGHEMVGIRLDSGNLSELSIAARRLLDSEGFCEATIVASNDLDEFQIEQLKDNGAKITVWGVGTKLATAYDQPALGGVYKLSAVKDRREDVWVPRIKLSEDSIKTSNPGILQVCRFEDRGTFVGDCLYDVSQESVTPSADDDRLMFDIENPSLQHRLPATATPLELLQPIFRDGRCVYDSTPIQDMRDRTLQQLDRLPEGCRAFVGPDQYPTGLSRSLHNLKNQLTVEAKANT